MLEIIVLALATWRITNLIVYEDGPWDIFEKARDLIGVRFNEVSERYGTNVVASAFTCLWCMSVWIGSLMIVSFWLTPEVTYWLMLPFALSAGAILIDSFISEE